MHAPGLEQDAWDAEAAMQQLAALGYVETPSGDLSERRKQAADFQKFALARVLLGNRKPAEAIPLLEELARGSPGPHVTLSLGQAYFRDGQFERSEQISSELLAKTEVHGLAHLLRANSCLFQGNQDDALGHLLQAEEAAALDPGILILVAQAYRRLRRLGDAEVNFRKVLELDPDRTAAWTGLAAVLLAQKRPVEAAEAAMEAVGRDFSVGTAHYLLGAALARAGSFDRAVQALENCVKLQPHSYLAHRWLQEIHTRATGDTRRAEHHRGRAAEIGAARRNATATAAAVTANA
jgi:tetratricopeptide (TPR) repeat protein